MDRDRVEREHGVAGRGTAPRLEDGGAVVDARAATVQLAAQQARADASPRVAQLREMADIADAATVQRNDTGMPDGLKAGIESLSGLDMSSVRVHRNSDKPAQLNAHAYAQRTDIHLAPGQERHLPHEAWHVVQQMQGRVQPTAQMKEVSINDDKALEREADVMGENAISGGAAAIGNDKAASATFAASAGERASHMYGSLAQYVAVDNGSKGQAARAVPTALPKEAVLQQKWGGDVLPTSKDVEIQQKLVALGYPTVPLWKIAAKRGEPKEYRTYDEIAHALNLQKTNDAASATLPSPGVERSSRDAITSEQSDGDSGLADREIGELVDRAQQLCEASHVQALIAVGSALRAEHASRQEAAMKAVMQPVESGEASGIRDTVPEHIERDHPDPLIINYVWIGDAQIDAVAKFNIYSWRALGHTVNVYVQRLDGRTATAEDLGLKSTDADVIDLGNHLKQDIDADTESTKGKMSGGKELLAGWTQKAREKVSRGEKITANHRFNMVDIAKSYIGATQRGIVLDMKVGPSRHLEKFSQSFKEKFVSYSRGGKNAAAVENQSMGTMQVSDELRSIYANRFFKALTDNWKMGVPKEQWINEPDKNFFGTLTSIHGRAFGQGAGLLGAKGMDVATQTPAGLNPGALSVSEPVAAGQGPFRVFKAAKDQTWEEGTKSATRPGDVKKLAQEVLSNELTGERLMRKAMKTNAEMISKEITETMYTAGW